MKRWKWCVALTNLQKHGISANRSGAIWCVALHGILLAWFLILPLGLKSSSAIPWCAAHSLAPVLLALDSVQHFIHYLHRFTILPNITNNLGSSGENVFCKIQDGVPLKLKKTVQRSNTRAIPVDQYQFRPTLIFAGQYCTFNRSPAAKAYKLIEREDYSRYLHITN